MKKYTNKGTDRMGSKKDGLKYDWYNGSFEKEITPCQVSTGQINDIMKLRVFAWTNAKNHDEYLYEANFSIYGETIISSETNYKSRLKAQKEAEKLIIKLRDMLNEII